MGDVRDDRRYPPLYAAKLASVHASTVRAWMPDLAGGEATLASFLDLVELRIMRQLRERYRLQPGKLRWMHDEARRRTGDRHPFASHPILLEERRVWLLRDDGGPVELGTDGQTGLPEVVQQVAKEIDWDEVGRALRWRPALGVVVDPSVRWGQPVVEGTRIPTAALYAAFLASNVPDVAELYNLTVNQVHHAVEFEARLAA